MKAKLLLTILLAAICSQAFAQTFVNGSLEGGAVPCNRVLNSQFPTFVGGAGFAFGTPNHGGFLGMIYFFDGTCSEGPAKHGSNFLGLAANDAGLVDAMSLKMTAPLLANKTYALTFFAKKSPNAKPDPIALQVGYSNDSLAFGTLADAVQPPTSSNWVRQTVYIRPTTSAKYVTVRGVRTSSGTFEYGYTYVDSFKIAIGTAVELDEALLAVSPHPNPFTTRFSLTLSSDVKLPARISMTDVLGRVVYTGQSITRNRDVPRGNLPTGIYLLQIEDAEGRRASSRVVAE